MTNKEGLWKSDDPWKFEDFDGKFVNIVNTKKNEVLGIRKSDNSTGRVISEGVWSHLTPKQSKSNAESMKKFMGAWIYQLTSSANPA